MVDVGQLALCDVARVERGAPRAQARAADEVHFAKGLPGAAWASAARWILVARSRGTSAPGAREVRDFVSSDIGGRFGPGVDLQRQYRRKPCRCHRTTVSGRTTTRWLFRTPWDSARLHTLLRTAPIASASVAQRHTADPARAAPAPPARAVEPEDTLRSASSARYPGDVRRADEGNR